MSFFNLLFWNNSHMNLKYVRDAKDASIRVTQLYNDKKVEPNVLRDVSAHFGERIRKADRQVVAMRMLMILALFAFVLLPAIVVGAVQGNYLLIGLTILYVMIAYFIVECFIQVKLNRVLYEIDQKYHA